MTQVLLCKNKLFLNQTNDKGRRIYRKDVAFHVYEALKAKNKDLVDSIKVIDPFKFDKWQSDSLLINWGVSYKEGAYESLYKLITDEALYNVTILNKPTAVSLCVDKTMTLQSLSYAGVKTLQYTTDICSAYDWFRAGNHVFCRMITKGTGGEGIVVVQRKDNPEIKSRSDFPTAPLYTRYFKKNREFRYHIFDGKLIAVQEKRKMSKEKLEENNITTHPMIRNWQYGWVFCHEDVPVFDQITEHCQTALASLKLDFGAIDVLANCSTAGSLQDFAICEVNSSPGLEGHTLDVYVEAITQKITYALFIGEGAV